MANITKRYTTHISTLRRHASVRSGDEKAILLGWADMMETKVNQLLKGGPPDPNIPGAGPSPLPPGDVALFKDVLNHALIQSWDHDDDICSLKATPWMTPEEIAACGPRYAKIVAEAPWALPLMVKPKGQWGGKR